MLRRTLTKRCPTANGPYWKTASFHAGDDSQRKGAFSVEAEAERLGIHPRFAQGILMKADQSFKTKGRGHPAMYGRTSRPGSKACTKETMFPLYCTTPEVKYALGKSKRILTTK